MVLLQRHADVLSLRMQIRVLVVPHISTLRRKDAVVAAELAVLAGKPRRAALAEYDVPGNHIFTYTMNQFVLPPKTDHQTPAQEHGDADGKVMYLPPLFFAPKRLPGPSFAPFARP